MNAFRLLQLAGLWLAGCGSGEAGRFERPPVELLPIERLAFVPPGRSLVAGRIDCGSNSALLVDRFEVRRGDWLAFEEERAGMVATAAVLFAVESGQWPPETVDWPATGMNLFEAQAYAENRGMRLPSAVEWMWIAAGPQAQPWPWSTTPQISAANTVELGLGRPAPTGSFEHGQTPSAVHDMLGNVWEWVTPPLPRQTIADWVEPEVGVDPPGGPTPRSATVMPISGITDGLRSHENWAMGGSYLTTATPLYGRDRRNQLYFLAMGLEPQHRAIDVGLRCVAPARRYLVEHAAEWSSPKYRERLIAVGRSRSWRRRAVSLLESLTQDEGAPAALSWLLEGARQ